MSAAPTPDATRFFFFGDSLTLGVGDALALGWVGRLMREVGTEAQSALASRCPTPVTPVMPATFYNLGVRGDTSEDIARRFPGELVARCPEGVAPRVVFAFGVNDARTLRLHGPSLLPSEATLRHTRDLIERAQRLGPVLMVGPPAVADAASDARIAQRSEELAGLCAELRAPFVRVHARTRDDAMYLPALRGGDGYHPGAAGYDLLAEIVRESAEWRAFARHEGPLSSE